MRGGALHPSVLSKKLNPLRRLPVLTFRTLNIVARTLVPRTCIELLLILQLPTITLHVLEPVVVGPSPSLLVATFNGEANGRRTVRKPFLLLLLNTGKLTI